MDNENKENIDSPNNDAEGQEGAQGQDNNQDNRHQETPEAKRARLTRQLEQLDKKYPVQDKEAKPAQKASELDYGQKAFLAVNGLKGSEEYDLAKRIMDSTGKPLEDVLESKYFKAELDEMREIKASQDATPKGTKRTAQSGRDTVDYWLAKGELPPVGDVELRRKVVNARYEKESKKGVFYNSGN